MSEQELQEERRKNDSLVLSIMTAIRADVQAMQKALSNHIHDEPAMFRQLLAEAFPDGDAAAHKKVHEAWIAKVKASTDFWLDLSKTLAKWGLIGLAGWLAVVVWQAFLHGPKS